MSFRISQKTFSLHYKAKGHCALKIFIYHVIWVFRRSQWYLFWDIRWRRILNLLTFRDNVYVLSWMVKCPGLLDPLKVGSINSSETSVSIWNSTMRKITEQLRYQGHLRFFHANYMKTVNMWCLKSLTLCTLYKAYYNPSNLMYNHPHM